MEINIFTTTFFLDVEFLKLFIFCVLIGALFRINLSVIHGQVWTRTKSQQLIFSTLPAVGYVITSVISGNIALSLGMVGALSIVRFRSPIKNPYELVSYFFLITVGITTSVNPNIALNFFLASVGVSISIEVINYLAKKYNLNSPIYETDEYTENNYLIINLKKSESTFVESTYLKSYSFDDSKYIYNFSSKNIDNLNELIEIPKSKDIISYYFEKS